MNEVMKISILVPIYGVEKYIERCASSLLEQSYENIEFIFVDDCTNDNSITLLLKTLKRYPSRKDQVKIIKHKRNMGLGEARNSAVASATGDFIFHVDSDDYIDKDCIRLCVERQLSTNADIVSVGIINKFANCSIPVNIPYYRTPEDLNEAVLRHDIPNNIWGRLIRRSLYLKHNIKVEGVNASEDLNVLPRLLFFAQKIAFINDQLYYYECSNVNSCTSSISEDKWDQILVTMKILYEFFVSKNDRLIEALHVRFARCIFDIAKNCATTGRKMYYEKIMAYLPTIPYTAVSQLEFPLRLGLRIQNYILFKYYVKIALLINTIIRK